MRVIALLTDFGLSDHYVGVMKGVILSINPNAKIVDISHNVRKYDIRAGAYLLASSINYFPKGTIFTAVVDPTVGKVKPLLIRTSNYFLVGPDNGLLILAAYKDGLRRVYEIDKKKVAGLREISSTFYGRDVYAPTAAYLSLNTKPEELGREIKEFVVPVFSKPVVEDNEISGEILYIDSFGDCITNITADALKKLKLKKGDILRVEINREAYYIPFCESYGDVKEGEALLLIESSNYLELAVNRGNASKQFNLKTGDKIHVRKITPSR